MIQKKRAKPLYRERRLNWNESILQEIYDEDESYHDYKISRFDIRFPSDRYIEENRLGQYLSKV